MLNAQKVKSKKLNAAPTIWLSVITNTINFKTLPFGCIKNSSLVNAFPVIKLRILIMNFILLKLDCLTVLVMNKQYLIVEALFPNHVPSVKIVIKFQILIDQKLFEVCGKSFENL